MAADAPRPAFTPVASTSSLLQITFSLLLVLAVIMAVAWLLKRMNMTQPEAGKLLRVIGSIPVGQRERVVLVEVKDTWLVIGIAPGQIRTLHTLEKSEDFSPPSQSNSTFSTLLGTMIKSRSPARHENAP